MFRIAKIGFQGKKCSTLRKKVMSFKNVQNHEKNMLVKKNRFFTFPKNVMSFEKKIFWAWKIFQTKFCFFFTMNKMSENGWKHEKRRM